MKPQNKQFSEELGLSFILILLISIALKSFGIIPFSWYGLFIFSVGAVAGGTLVVGVYVLVLIMCRLMIDRWKESNLIKKVKKKLKKF
jgi:hypothetical protein